MTIETKKIVVKFGGSNLKQKEDITRLVRAVKAYQQPIVIVISALYGVTDMLVYTLTRITNEEAVVDEIKQKLLDLHFQILDLYIEDTGYRNEVKGKIATRVAELVKYLWGIHCLGEVPNFASDRVLSYGERLSSLVMSAILTYQHIPCREILPEDLGLYTNGEYGNATVDFHTSEEEVKANLECAEIAVIPGFYGISRDGKVTLLGRGGTDYTAAAVACCINAASVDLWKDVPGFMTADPKLVQKPEIIHCLTYNEAAELSYFGARIAHPRTFEPVEEKKIPVRLFNILDFDDNLTPVTIISENGIIAKDIIKSVTYSDDFAVLKMHGAGVGIKPGIMAAVTSGLADAGINIKSIITSQTCINILLSRRDVNRGLHVVEHLPLVVVDQITAINDIALIAVVGEGILDTPGIAARILTAVSAHHINVTTISAGASNVAVYFIIHRDDRAQAIQAIHNEFFPNSRTPGK